MEQSSRSERKTKRRKTNRILNTAIAVVVLLIIIVGFTIFAGGNEEEPAAPKETTTEQQTAGTNEQTDEQTAEEETTEKQAEEKEKTETTDPAENEKAATEEETEEKEVIVTEGTEPNVEEEIVDPSWEGVGTSQSGQHTSSFETDSQDWAEKEQALSYATGIPSDNMTIWFISGNGPKGAIGTVSPKSNPDDAYRVYIEWADGEGWKPTKVQKLEENDKGR